MISNTCVCNRGSVPPLLICSLLEPCWACRGPVPPTWLSSRERLLRSLCAPPINRPEAHMSSRVLQPQLSHSQISVVCSSSLYNTAQLCCSQGELNKCIPFAKIKSGGVWKLCVCTCVCVPVCRVCVCAHAFLCVCL